MRKIYLDYNATTQLDPRVIEAMQWELRVGPSNPSSIHSFGRAARARLSRARQQVASYLGVLDEEIIFTSSGTESLNLALHGLQIKGTIITTRIEHAAMFNTIQRMGNPVCYLPVGEKGHIDLQDLENAASNGADLIALSAVNSETGVKNPLKEIAEIAEKYGIPCLIDGVALLGKEAFSIPKGITMMAFSSHKIHGPKGVGLLFVRKKTKLSPLFSGGAQERMLRPGTENLTGIIGFAKAVEILAEELPKAAERMSTLQKKLERIEGIEVVGTGPRVCNTSSLMFPKIDGEALLFTLDQAGIAVSMGSACSSGSLEPSRVLLEMGLSRKQALSTLRFSLSRFTTEEEIEMAVKILSEQLSALAPKAEHLLQ